MADRREQILVRIAEVMGTVSGVTVKRMETTVEASERPCIVVNDGNEEAHDTPHKGSAPNLIDLRPVIFVFVVSSDRAGSELNAIRAAAIRALVFDDTLKSLTGTNGIIKYLGCQAGVQLEEAMAADMALLFELTYVLNPAAL